MCIVVLLLNIEISLYWASTGVSRMVCVSEAGLGLISLIRPQKGAGEVREWSRGPAADRIATRLRPIRVEISSMLWVQAAWGAGATGPRI